MTARRAAPLLLSVMVQRGRFIGALGFNIFSHLVTVLVPSGASGMRAVPALRGAMEVPRSPYDRMLMSMSFQASGAAHLRHSRRSTGQEIFEGFMGDSAVAPLHLVVAYGSLVTHRTMHRACLADGAMERPMRNRTAIINA